MLPLGLTMKLNFDENRFLETARVVLRYNEHAVGYTVEEIVAQMKALAQEHQNSICGTGGYYVASCPGHEPGTLYVSAFPAPWLIPV